MGGFWYVYVACALLLASSSKAGSVTAGIQNAAVLLGTAAEDNGLRLTVKVAPFAINGSALPAQNLLLDTGSSTLAFCDASIVAESEARPTAYTSCMRYNAGGKPIGYRGKFFYGRLLLGDNITLPGNDFAVMQQQVRMPCTGSFQGVFGIAFSQLNVGFEGPGPQWAEGSVGDCPDTVPQSLMPPLLEALHVQGGPERIGIYWSGQVGDNTGALYLNDAATENPHYVPSAMSRPAKLGEFGWYDIDIRTIQVGKFSYKAVVCKPGNSSTNCMLDTGMPGFIVPAEVFNAMVQAGNEGRDPPLTFYLAPAEQGEEPVVLSFNSSDLIAKNMIKPGSNESGIILGLPLWSYYYTVMGISDKSVVFVPTGNANSSVGNPVTESNEGEQRRLRGSTSKGLPQVVV